MYATGGFGNDYRMKRSGDKDRSGDPSVAADVCGDGYCLVLGGLLAGFKLIDSPVVRFVMFPHRVEVALCYK